MGFLILVAEEDQYHGVVEPVLRRWFVMGVIRGIFAVVRVVWQVLPVNRRVIVRLVWPVNFKPQNIIQQRIGVAPCKFAPVAPLTPTRKLQGILHALLVHRERYFYHPLPDVLAALHPPLLLAQLLPQLLPQQQRHPVQVPEVLR